MNEAQIEYELKKAKNDLTFWIDHKNNRVMGNDGGMMDVCDMKIASARERIGDLKRLRFALHCNEQV
jgi:hypothetical protein